MGAIIVLAVPVVLAAVVVGLYNSMASLRIRTQEAWSGIDTQLKRRYDLIPNLVETVKGYAKHEKEAFEQVSRLRAEALGARTVGERSQAEAGLAEALKTVFAVAEAYPELKASDNFKDLQKNLAEIEDALQNARRY